MVRGEYLAQVRLLLAILPIVARQAAFALKGGTALNFFVNDLPRLSVDIDLTYLPIKPRSESLREIHMALFQIAREAESQLKPVYPKMRVKGAPNSAELSKLFISDGGAMVKIEPNTVFRGAVFPSRNLSLTPVVQKMFEVEIESSVMSNSDLYGGKICAALDRQHPRDLFDLKILYEKDGLTHDIRKAFVVYAVGHERPIHELLRPTLLDLHKYFMREFVGMALSEVSFDELVSVRERLINDINSQLTLDERRFLLSIKEGNPNWILLNQPGIETLPALRWKLQNIRKLEHNKHQKIIGKLREVLGI